MGPLYTTELQTSAETVHALSRAVYNLYGTAVKRRIAIAALLLATVGLSLGLHSRLGLVLTALACLLLSQYRYPAVYRARRVIEAFGGNLPRIRYDFHADRFTMTIGGESRDYHYDILKALYREKNYLYLFTDENTAFMLDPAALDPAEPERFREDLSAWTGLGWSTPKPFLLQSLPLPFFRKRAGSREAGAPEKAEDRDDGA